MGWRKETAKKNQYVIPVLFISRLLGTNFMFKIQIALYQSLMDPHDTYQSSIKSGP